MIDINDDAKAGLVNIFCLGIFYKLKVSRPFHFCSVTYSMYRGTNGLYFPGYDYLFMA